MPERCSTLVSAYISRDLAPRHVQYQAHCLDLPSWEIPALQDNRYADLPDEELRLVSVLCESFERALQSKVISIEGPLRAAPPSLREFLFPELLAVELESRLSRQERPSVADYEIRFPDHRQAIQTVFAEFGKNLPRGSDTSREDSDLTLKIRSDTSSGTSPPFMAGDERYQREGVVGTGGMGVVIKVRDQNLSRHLAMKVLQLPRDAEGRSQQHSDNKAPTSAYARFLEEAHVTAQLEHPGVVPVHELGTDEAGAPFFTMRLVKGRSLTEIIELARQEQEGWNLSRAVGVIVKACFAVAYAHSKGVIHRDLKPSNIMVGRFGEVYVMDWGLAKVTGQQDLHDLRLKETEEATEPQIESHRSADSAAKLRAALRTMDGAVVGTPTVMPPEQAAGRVEEVDQRSDVYSLGAILYSLLVGQLPYVRSSDPIGARTVLELVRHGPPQPIREIDANAPAELVAICEEAMARRQHDRYPSCLELAEDLQAWIDGRVVKAYESGVVAELKKWVGRNWALASSIAAAVMLLVGGVMTVVVLQRSANERLASTNQELTTAEQTISVQLHAAQVEQAQLTFAKGLELAERGDVDYGMMWMLKALQVAPKDMEDFEEMARRNLSGWSRLIPRLLQNWDDGVTAADFSPDGSLLALAAGEQLHIVDVRTASEIRPAFEFPSRQVSSVDFHPKEPHVAVALTSQIRSVSAESRPHSALLLELPSGREVIPPLIHEGGLTWVFFSQDGATLFTVHSQRVLTAWDVETGEQQRTVEVEGSPPTQVRLSPDGERIVFGGLSIPPIDADTFEPLEASPSQLAETNHAFHPDGSLLVGLQSSRGTPLLELRTALGGTQSDLELRGGDEVDSYYFFPDGSSLLSPEDQCILEWETARRVWSPIRVRFQGEIDFTVAPNQCYGVTRHGLWQLPRPLSRPAASVLEEHAPGRLIRFTRSGSEPMQYTQSRDVFIHREDVRAPRATAARIRDAQTGFPRTRPLRLRGNGSWDVALSRDGRIAATTVVTELGDWGFIEGETAIWDAVAGKRLHGPLSPCSPMRALELSPDGEVLVASDTSGWIYFWSTTTGERIGEPIEGTEVAVALVFSPDGSTLAAGFGPSQVRKGHYRLFHAETHKPLGDPIMNLDGGWETFLEFTPDGENLITGNWLAGVVVREAKTGSVCYAIRPSQEIGDLDISADGSRFALGESNGSIRVFDLATGRQVDHGMKHPNRIQAIALSSDGRLVAAGSSEGTVRLWDVATSQPLGPPRSHRFTIWDVHFSRDGQSFTSTDWRGVTHHWPLPRPARGTPDQLLAQLETWTLTTLDGGAPTLLTKQQWQKHHDTISREGRGREWYSEPVDPIRWHTTRAADAEGDANWFTAFWHLTRLIEFHPNDWRLYARRGRAQVHRGQIPLAQTDFSKVAESQGDRTLIDWIANCAYDCREQEAWEVASIFLDRLIDAEPDNWQWFADQAEALGQLDRKEQQQAAFAKALELCHESLAPHFTRAMVQAGNWETLQAAYARVEKRGWLSLQDWKTYAMCARKLQDDEGHAKIVARLQDLLGPRFDAAALLLD